MQLAHSYFSDWWLINMLLIFNEKENTVHNQFVQLKQNYRKTANNLAIFFSCGCQSLIKVKSTWFNFLVYEYRKLGIEVNVYRVKGQALLSKAFSSTRMQLAHSYFVWGLISSLSVV